MMCVSNYGDIVTGEPAWYIRARLALGESLARSERRRQMREQLEMATTTGEILAEVASIMEPDMRGRRFRAYKMEHDKPRAAREIARVIPPREEIRAATLAFARGEIDRDELTRRLYQNGP